MFQRFREKIERDFYLKYKYTFSLSIKIRLGNVIWIERSSQLSSLGDDDATHFKKRRRISSYSNSPLNDDSILRRQITVKTSNVFKYQLFLFCRYKQFQKSRDTVSTIVGSKCLGEIKPIYQLTFSAWFGNRASSKSLFISRKLNF